MRTFTLFITALALCGVAFGQGLQGEMRRLYNVDRGTVAGKEVPNFLAGFEINGSDFTTTELTALDGITAGTITASKALVVDANKKIGNRIPGGLLSSRTAAGTNFTAAVEAIMNGGTATIPANTLAVGDVVRYRIAVAVPTTDGTDTLALNLRVGGLAGSVLTTIPAVDPANNDLVIFDGQIVVRSATKAFSTVSTAGLVAGTPMASAAMGVGGTLAAELTVDLTAAITIDLTAVWSDATGNACSVQSFNVFLN